MSESITRRGVLAGAAALAGMTALPQLLHGSAIGHVVVDKRLAHSAAFAAGFDIPRVHHVGALDDLCNRWYTRMRREVLADTRHIAGLTTWMDYIIMHGCAAEIGYRGSFHSEHLASPDSTPSWAQALGRSLARGARPAVGAVTGTVAADEVRMVAWVFSPRSV
jgi:hypothetical protein